MVKIHSCWGRVVTRVMVFLCVLSLCSPALSSNGASMANQVDEEPSAMAMAVDAVAVRPIMLGVTVLGTALWVVTLPFSAAGGNVRAAADTLVVEPAMTTFVRCLGCTKPGYKQ